MIVRGNFNMISRDEMYFCNFDMTLTMAHDNPKCFASCLSHFCLPALV